MYEYPEDYKLLCTSVIGGGVSRKIKISSSSHKITFGAKELTTTGITNLRIKTASKKNGNFELALQKANYGCSVSGKMYI